VAAAAVTIVLYVGLSNWLTVHAAERPWAIAALLGPIWIVGFLAALRQRHLIGLGALAAVALAVAAIVARGGVGDVSRLYVMQHVGIHIALCVSFGITLLRKGGSGSDDGGEASLSLIGRIAKRVHGSLTPDMTAYTRRVTTAWTVYFMCMAWLSVAIYALAPWATWSLLANVVTPIAIVAMFVGEHVLRYRLHPEFERASLMDALRAYRGAETREAT
jgi:uncharacterized membrane protein